MKSRPRLCWRALGARARRARRGARLYQAARAEQAPGGRPPRWPGYVEPVRDIAPRQLLDREAELAELADWCVSGDEAYVRWQAGPGAGKSALMSWLVLHPPPGTWVISFFVTASRSPSPTAPRSPTLC